MSDHTAINLREDLEDLAAKYGYAEQMEARFAGRALGLEKTGMSLQRLMPGVRQPFGHRHREQEEIYVVLAGSGRIRVEEEEIELGPLDAVRVAPGAARCLEGGEEGMQFLAFGAPAHGSPGEDSEQLPGWWGGS